MTKLPFEARIKNQGILKINPADKGLEIIIDPLADVPAESIIVSRAVAEEIAKYLQLWLESPDTRSG